MNKEGTNLIDRITKKKARETFKRGSTFNKTKRFRGVGFKV